ncbi:MAG TPA: hypothetical protein GXZ20_00235 [Halanaerobiaceae bacterium]|jgi:hypothetical protein|nr:hypothetical protein [Bacillota bacterium]HHU91548.1 hypothetical protein [Halanaerobiaceae bacterium]HOA41237.1 hypothetical protein [Halanaerobiales bacterium]HPZ63640.1 hypothetical protein [Halanaerobiales bacterium]HQD04884.1 hypothetical protein [Halanaerobiales bacterium]
MLIIKCAKCKAKLLKYNKIGMGRVLRCWKDRIKQVYEAGVQDGHLLCLKCNNIIAEDVGDFYKMDRNAFTYTGTKVRK